MTETKRLESENIFSNIENFSQFILKYKNNFEKQKYFQLDKNFKIIGKEPSFILELAYIHFCENEKNEKSAVRQGRNRRSRAGPDDNVLG